MSAAAQWWAVLSVGQGLVLVASALLIGGVAALGIEVRRTRWAARALLEEVRDVRQLLDAHGHDLLQETELLRGTVEEVRDDTRADRMLDELRRLQAGQVGTRPGGGSTG